MLQWKARGDSLSAIGGGAVHVGFRAVERRSGFFGLRLGAAPALPANREAVALQGRAERAGALRQSLAARPALAVALLSFASQAKAEGRWREGEAESDPAGARLQTSDPREIV